MGDNRNAGGSDILLFCRRISILLEVVSYAHFTPYREPKGSSNGLIK